VPIPVSPELGAPTARSSVTVTMGLRVTMSREGANVLLGT